MTDTPMRERIVEAMCELNYRLKVGLGEWEKLTDYQKEPGREHFGFIFDAALEVMMEPDDEMGGAALVEWNKHRVTHETISANPSKWMLGPIRAAISTLKKDTP